MTAQVESTMVDHPNNYALKAWKMNGGCRVIPGCVDCEYWIEENTNYSEGKGNLFLVKGVKDRVSCGGGVDKAGPRSSEWIASIATFYDEETDRDCTEIYRGSREEAIKALWANRTIAEYP